MDAKAKAQELVESFQTIVWKDGEEIGYITKEGSIQCAIIAVEEILEAVPMEPMESFNDTLEATKYWQSVLSELRTLA